MVEGQFMMTSSNGNIFRVTGHLGGEFTGHRWIPLTKASGAELWCFPWSAHVQRLCKQSRRRWFETPSRSLWHHCNKYIEHFLLYADGGRTETRTVPSNYEYRVPRSVLPKALHSYQITGVLCYQRTDLGAWARLATNQAGSQRASLQIIHTPRVGNYMIYIYIYIYISSGTWWRRHMETFSALLAICAGNSPLTVEFPAQRPVTRSFDIFFDLRLNKRSSKQWWRWWFETPSRPLWRQCDDFKIWKCDTGGYVDLQYCMPQDCACCHQLLQTKLKYFSLCICAKSWSWTMPI